jgi:hypothetical protein
MSFINRDCSWTSQTEQPARTDATSDTGKPMSPTALQYELREFAKTLLGLAIVVAVVAVLLAARSLLVLAIVPTH